MYIDIDFICILLSLQLFKAFRARFSTAITEPYQKGFQQANAAFQYQFVFDIDSKRYDRLNPIPRNLTVSDFYLLGQDPQNRFLTVLRTNKAARFPRFDSCEAQRKNTVRILYVINYCCIVMCIDISIFFYVYRRWNQKKVWMHWTLRI